MVAVVTLALAIGANTAIFSVVNAVLLRPLPYHEPDRLVTINHFYPSLDNLEASVSVPGFRDYRDRTKSFDGVAVETGWNPNLTGPAEPERVIGARVSGLFFATLGVAPAVGRALLPEDDEPGRNLVVVLSHGFWQRHFGGGAAVGETLILDGERYDIVGVMPPGFRDFFNRDVEIWTPVAFTPEQFSGGRTNEFLALTARLKPGVTIEKAAAEMAALAEQLKQEYPGSYAPDWSLRVTLLGDRASRTIRPALLVLLGAVALVLLIACANLANLLLARAATQVKEIAVRSALGASRPRLIRQLLTESLVLSLAGGTLGLFFAYWGMRSLMAMSSAGLPWAGDVTIDGTVLAFTLAVSLATSALFGLAPALQLSGANLAVTLREGGRGAASDRTSHTIRKVLVVAEVGLALMLLAGAGLLVKSFAKLQGVDPGFRAQNVLTANIALPATKYPTAAAQAAFFDELLQRLAAVPGVSAAGATTVLPFSGGWTTGSFRIEGYVPPSGTPNPWGDLRTVSPDFRAALGIPLTKGRFFTDEDREGTQAVVVIDEEMVRRYWPNTDPIGKRIAFGGQSNPAPQWREVVGVVGHTKHEGLDAEDRVQLYFPYRQVGRRDSMWLVVRTAGDPIAFAASVSDVVQSMDRDQPLSRLTTMEGLIEESLGQRRLSTLLLALFAATALLLASLGLYGLMSYVVTERSREIGLRMALGAERSRVLSLLMRQGLGLVAIGLAGGLAGGFALTRLLTTQLFGVEATDPLTFVAVVVLLLGVAALATLLPALRATRVDPVEVLRN